MFDFLTLNHRLQELPFPVFRDLCTSHDVAIEDGDLKIILKIIKNNPYSVLNDDYSEILLFEISAETTQDIGHTFRPMIDQKYIIEELNNN